jgi:CHAT domain-containing protein
MKFRLSLKLMAAASAAITILFVSFNLLKPHPLPGRYQQNTKNPRQLLDKANHLLSLADSYKVPPLCRRTERLLQSSGNASSPVLTTSPDKGHRLLGEANRLVFQYNWPSAGPRFAAAEEIFARSGDERDRLYAHVGRLRGLVETLSLPDVSREIGTILSRPIAQNDNELRLLCLISKGDIDFQINPLSSEAMWEQVRILAQNSHDAVWENRAQAELGAITFYKGEIWRAMHIVVQSYDQAARLNDSSGMVRELTALGEGYAEFGRSKDALRFFETAIERAHATDGAEVPFTAYLGKARMLLVQNHADEGRALLETVFRDACKRHMQVREARVRLVLGSLVQTNGDLKLALAHFQRAAAIASQQQLHRLLAAAASKLAASYAQQDRNQQALLFAKASVGADRRGKDSYDLPRLLVLVAEQEACHGSLQDAQTTYEQAVSLVDELLSNVPTFQDKNVLIGTMGAVYKSYFQFAIDRLHDPKEGFRVLEQARARGIADFLRDATVEGRERAIKSGISDVTGLVRDFLRPIHEQLRFERDANRRQALELALWERERLTVLSGEQNKWSGLDHAKPVSLDDFQRILVADEVVLEYNLATPRSTVLVITRNNVSAYALRDATQINELASRYREEILSGKQGIRESRQLYDELLGPVELQLRSRLVIVPDGELQRVPLEALLDSKGHPMLESQTIAYSPSATVEHFLRSPHAPQLRPSRCLFVGDASSEDDWQAVPSFSVRQIVVPSGLFDIGGAPHYVRLPGSGEEVANAARALNGRNKLLMGAQATEAAVKSEPLPTYQVLHFATHGILNTDFPERSALVLGDNADSGEDGFLQAREIVRLPLNADLVTISACKMALGRPDGAAGETNIIHSFLLAGARTVVASLWSADDNLTSDLMQRFYQLLAAGEDKASALRDAKLSVMHEFGLESQPLQWAGFELYGDGPDRLN